MLYRVRTIHMAGVDMCDVWRECAGHECALTVLGPYNKPRWKPATPMERYENYTPNYAFEANITLETDSLLELMEYIDVNADPDTQQMLREVL